MKVKEWVDRTLILDGDIDKGVEEAFNEDRYLEAFTLLQAQIDWWLASIHQMVALRTGMVSRTKELENWNLGEMISTYPFRFKDSAKFLRDNGVLTDSEYGVLFGFYNFRNRMIHRLIVRSYQPVSGADSANRNDITRAEAKEQFEKGRGLVKLLTRKTAENSPFTSVSRSKPFLQNN
jgi:hypothetical protein